MTEVSREGRTYKDKEEPIGTTPDHLAGTAVDCVISWKSLPLTFLNSRHLVWCCHVLLIWLGPDISASSQPSGCLLLVWTPFSSLIFLADISFSRHPCLMMPLSLHLVCACHLWILTAPLLLTAQELGTWHTLLSWQISFPTLFILYSFHCCFPAVSYSLQFPTLFTSRLQLSTSHCISIVFTSLLSWHLYSSPLPSSHLYSLHIVSSSHLYSLSTSAVFTSLSSV